MSKELYMKTFNGDKIFSLEYDKETLKDMVLDLQGQLQQKENIIKEVRELANKPEFTMQQKYEMRESILEILDKENKDE